jgi:hypothetical protein
MFKKTRRVAFAVLLALLALNLLGVRPFGTSGEWICFVGTCVIGHEDADVIELTTDAGTVTVDNYVQADVGPFVELASGNLTANTINIATAAADYVMPACETANIGEWVTVLVRDVSEVVVLQPATGDTLSPAGAIVSQNHELDSAGAATSDGDFVTFVCFAADIWHSIAIGGAWVDGGAS